MPESRRLFPAFSTQASPCGTENKGANRKQEFLFKKVHPGTPTTPGTPLHLVFPSLQTIERPHTLSRALLVVKQSGQTNLTLGKISKDTSPSPDFRNLQKLAKYHFAAYWTVSTIAVSFF